MKKVLLLLLLCTISTFPMKKRKTKHMKGWRLKNKRIAVQNMPDERMRRYHRRPQIQRQQQEDDVAKCLDYTKGIVSILASLTAIGITIATFVIVVAA